MPNLHGLRRNRDYERLLKYSSSSQEKVKRPWYLYSYRDKNGNIIITKHLENIKNIDGYREMRAFELAMMPNQNIPDYDREKYSVRKGRYIDKDGYLVDLSAIDIAREDLLSVLKNIANKKLEASLEKVI